ncbi:sigma-54-dependent Fis family transcriptional regulator [Acidaminobacter sp. JC074]|uniref:sigma-54 interaction domain-containing protein n=1 Tax=Acidaminobacter sp. JC074 TaxID=2530199 RepID=UPI001F108990|nr:sigma 54-interacting transcriptional regulator [Acidaminobacter sp. JC074]
MNYKIGLNDFLDDLNEGIISINKEGLIQVYNTKAKDILGASRHCHLTHEAGKLEKGDMVILAFTSFGQDTGGIDHKDLKVLGIDIMALEKGTTLLAVGQYKTGKSGKIKLKGPDHSMDSIAMEDVFLGENFKTKIDYINRYVEISIYDENYRYYYNNYFNHMVIVNPKKRRVKFYQMGGYTLWKEDLKDLLKGGAFKEKHLGLNEMDLVNAHLSKFHQEDEIITDFLACARGEQDGYNGKSGTINGINIISTLKPILRENQVVGAILLMHDIRRLQMAENQRNIAYRKLKEATNALEDVKKYQVSFQNIIGSSQKIMDIKKLAYKASQFKSTVLILGESGTGKSVLAKAIHQASSRKAMPFIEVNLNSIPSTLIESELFGYEKGAFTGASARGKKGYFELAHGGTIFLDEIGDLKKEMQVKLLHVIQNRTFYKVGGDKEVKVDVRIIVATNRKLEKDVKQGLFREDLYYRINVFPIKQPPLRERIDDIYELVNYILPKVCYNIGTDDKAVSAEAYEKMKLYHWPGNIRELENVLERAITLCDGKTILSEHIQVKITNKNMFSEEVLLRPLKETMKDVELDVINKVLIHTDGNKRKTMDILAIKKTKLYDSIKEIEKREIPK